MPRGKRQKTNTPLFWLPNISGNERRGLQNLPATKLYPTGFFISFLPPLFLIFNFFSNQYNIVLFQNNYPCESQTIKTKFSCRINTLFCSMLLVSKTLFPCTISQCPDQYDNDMWLYSLKFDYLWKTNAHDRMCENWALFFVCFMDYCENIL